MIHPNKAENDKPFKIMSPVDGIPITIHFPLIKSIVCSDSHTLYSHQSHDDHANSITVNLCNRLRKLYFRETK